MTNNPNMNQNRNHTQSQQDQSQRLANRPDQARSENTQPSRTDKSNVSQPASQYGSQSAKKSAAHQ